MAGLQLQNQVAPLEYFSPESADSQTELLRGQCSPLCLFKLGASQNLWAVGGGKPAYSWVKQSRR